MTKQVIGEIFKGNKEEIIQKSLDYMKTNWIKGQQILLNDRAEELDDFEKEMNELNKTS